MRTSLIAAALTMGIAATANAVVFESTGQLAPVSITPLMEAGAPPDSPAARIDPNVLTSPYTGVVSINLRFIDAAGAQESFICSGTAIDPWHILTAGHCVDPLENGVVVDITKPGNDVRVVLNDSDPFTAATDLITVDRIDLNPDFDGFNVCPDGSIGCVNDDIAILRLPTALPSTVQTYQI